MATQVQLRRGTTTQTNSFTGAVGEVTVDTDKDTLVVHDGSTAGGFPLARESQLAANLVFSQAAFTQANAAFSLANGTATVANTDVTNISVSAGTYGNSTHYGVVTVAANGRVTSVQTFAVQDPSSLAFAIALG